MENKQHHNDDLLLDTKADELVLLLKKGTVDSEHVKAVLQKINNAADQIHSPKKIESFSELDEGQDRLGMINDLEFLLSHHQLDSKVSKKYFLHEKLRKIVLIGIAVTMIILGLAMIIMPAPPYFEMFTIFYFSKDDGVTLMDVISVLIVLTGLYLFLNALLKKSNI